MNESNQSDQRTGRILKTGAALFSVQGITWTNSLVGVAVLPRLLGPGDLGILALAMTVVTMVGLLAAFGTSNYVVKETARTPDSTRSLTGNVLLVRLGLWAGASLILVPGALFFGSSTEARLVFLVTLVGGILSSAIDAFLAAFQGNQQVGRASLLMSSLAVAGQALTIAVLLGGGGVVGVSVSSTLTLGATALVLGVLFSRLFTGAVVPTFRAAKQILHAGQPYLAWDAGLKIYATVDIVLLSLLAASSDVGNYAFAYRLVSIPVFITTIITMAVYPALSASALQEPEWFRKVVFNAVRFAFVVTAPMSAGMAVLAGPIVRLLSGSEFDQAPILLVILALHIPPAAIHTVLGMSLFARDMQKRMAIVAWAAAFFNVVGNIALIPVAAHLWGNPAIAASATSVATELMVGCFIWKWSWGSIEGAQLMRMVARVVAATTVMAGAAALAYQEAGFFVAVATGALVYVVAGFVFGAFSLREVRYIRSTLAPQPASVEA